MSNEELAYMAGILDGEGSIMLSPYGKFVRAEVTITSTDLELLEWVKEKAERGVITSKKVYKDHHRPSFCWKVSDRNAISLLRAILPFMQINRKKAKAKLLIDDYENCTPRNGKYTETMLLDKFKLVEKFRALS